MTAAEIEDRIWERVDDNPDAPATCTAAEVLAAINEGQELFALLTLCIERTVSVTLTAGAAWGDVRSVLGDFLCPLQIAVAGTKVRPATLAELDAWNSDWQATAGTPERYATLGFNLFAVTPHPAIDTAASFTYAAAPVALVGDDFPEIPEEYHPALIDYGVYRVRLKEGAQGLKRGMANLQRFLESARECGDYVRARSRAARYDTLPFELALFDRSRLIADKAA